MSASHETALKLRGIALQVAQACLPHGRLEGNEYLAGDIYGRAGRSLRVRVFGDDDRVGVWADFAGDADHRGDLLDLIRFCLADGDRSVALAKAREFLDGKVPTTMSAAAPVPEAKRKRSTTQAARWLWRQTAQLRGTLGEVYLVGRGIDPAVAGVLRFLPVAIHGPTGRKCPAVVAPVHSPDHRFIGIQRIFLEDDGSQLRHPDPKLSLGDVRGGHIPLARPRGGADVRHVAEGVEDGLSLLTADPALWVDAVISASQLVNLPADPRAAVHLVHHDNDQAGRSSAEAFRANNGDDPDIILCPPPAPAKDINKLLELGGRAAVLRHLAI